jgi:hypothetical protein
MNPTHGFASSSRLLLIVAIFAWMQSSRSALAGDAKDAPSKSSSGVAVVELFTSEGCSSCPPADAALAEIVQQSATDHRPVYALAFHINYWDSLGWTDPFASEAFTDRQRQYVKLLKLDGPYTPQMIVNGTSEFVGSDRKTASHEIDSALATPAMGTLTLDLADASNAKIRATALPADTTINIAVVEDDLQSQVRRGENGGRTLHHQHVVRWFNAVPLPSSNELTIPIPKLANVNFDHASVIVFAQHNDDGHIINAASATFPAATAARK